MARKFTILAKAFAWLIFLLGAAGLWLPAAPAWAAVPYSVELVEVPDLDKAVVDTMKASSNLFQLKDKPPSSPAGLIRRALTDRDRLMDVFKSHGYYQGKVDMTVDGVALDEVEAEALREKESVKVVLTPVPGRRYTIGMVSLNGLESTRAADMAFPLEAGAPATGAAIVEAESDLIAKLSLEGYPYAEMQARTLSLDHEQGRLNVLETVDPGPWVTLGYMETNGNEFIESDFIALHQTWVPGDAYNPRTLERLRKELSQLEVFSSVKVRIEEKPDEKVPDGEAMDVLVDVDEKKQRFIGFGTDYSTTEGVGVNAFWGHRNLFGRAERLKVSARVGRLIENDLDNLDTSLKANLRKPHFLMKDLSLLVEGGLIEEHPDAFDRKAVTTGLGLERKMSRTLALGAGVSSEYSDITDNNGDREEFYLVGFPVNLRHDTTDNLLDPHRGMRNEINVTPYMPLIGESDVFTAAKWVSRAYYDVLDDGAFILAGRVALGSLFGDETEQIPSNKRFFAGGGGSVRGYAFQNVGPLDANGDPIGGRSLVELGVELRLRYKDFGIVPFIDGGNVFDSTLPRFDEDYQWGTGLGLRYYTGFGPIRADFAVPLNRRSGDDKFAFYISIGQSF